MIAQPDRKTRLTLVAPDDSLNTCLLVVGAEFGVAYSTSAVVPLAQNVYYSRKGFTVDSNDWAEFIEILKLICDKAELGLLVTNKEAVNNAYQ